MPRLQRANQAYSTLAVDITTTGQDSFSVVDSSSFPDAGPFVILINEEYMEVGTITKGTHTLSSVLRGQEGSTATTHTTGDSVRHVFSAKAHGELADSADVASDPHTLGGTAHSADTLADLNTKISDATLDDSSDTRDPTAHDLGGADHNADTLANLNSKVSDATLDDSSDSRTPTSHDNTAHSTNYAPDADLTSHEGDTTNPHSVDKSDVGLGNVTNDAQLPLSGGTLSGNVNFADNVAQRPEIKDYAETRVAANTGTTYTIDLTSGNVFDLTLTGNCTFTFSNPPASGKAGSFTLILKQDATGSRTTTWPTSVKWAGGTAPTLTTTASAIDILTFLTMDAGTTWYGMFAGAAFATPV